MNVDLEAVIAFIRREVPPPLCAELSERTELRADLRMAEEDADELLATFAQEFQVQAGDFDFTRYFPSEGLRFFGRKRARPVPLTLGMLMRAAQAGEWNTASIEA